MPRNIRIQALVNRASNDKKRTGKSYIKYPMGIEEYKVVEGTTVLMDIIPYLVTVDTNENAKKGERWYQKKILVHNQIGDEKLQVVCPKTEGKEHLCPICKYLAEQWDIVDKDDKDTKAYLSSVKAKHREVYNVLDGDGKVKLMEISYYCFGQHLIEELYIEDVKAILKEYDLDKDWDKMTEEEQILICNAEFFSEDKQGSTLKVRFRAAKMENGKTFPEVGRIDFIERDVIPKSALKKAVDLDNCFDILSYQEIELLFKGAESSDVTDIAEEDAPIERVKRGAVRASSAEKAERKPRARPLEREEAEEEDIAVKKDSTITEATKAEVIEAENLLIAKEKLKAERKAKKLEKEIADKAIEDQKRLEAEELELVNEAKEQEEEETTVEVETVTEVETEQEIVEQPQGCPHGFVYGDDCSSEDVCDDCALFTECFKKYNADN